MEVDLEGATDIEYELSKLRILMPKAIPCLRAFRSILWPVMTTIPGQAC